ncbi:hypothetical protein [Microvirga sp. BSC39]|uniref:hypothetical protein n=1 Tax=Microvirga sp. BSC39 TaxID=1549810 RepID=UPI0004E92EED|nr:hypothetical protein [Microvirga sp. BSC39]KFG68683.1 hypothetical protein JH26_14500 [Microvirga sp. BSC39]
MADKTGFKLWIKLALLIGAAIFLTAIGFGLADSCDSGFAARAIRKKEAAGCGEFWTNRYQTLVTGFLAAAIAGWAAVKLIEQIGIMRKGNHMLEEQLAMERARRDEERKVKTSEFFAIISAMRNLTMQARNEIVMRLESNEHQLALEARIERFRYLGNEMLDAEGIRLLDGCLNTIKIYTANERFTRDSLSKTDHGKMDLDSRLRNGADNFIHDALPALEQYARKKLGY